ncbi:Rubredoxin [hydrothermal vent metagenome]|uniref:Rubredoxin n=1 Tax=hydrothermal vent metagenome TaxID=652676 RepID=A0A3B1CLT6_9ZZZZ
MIDHEALFKISYGLYIVSSGDKEQGNGFISNTVFQVTSKPVRFAVGCNKDNYSSEIIERSGLFSISVLQQDTDSEIFGRFGFKSGRDFNKMEGMNIKIGETGVPIVLNDSIAYLECKVSEKIDIGTHWLFIGEVINAEILKENIDPITYSYYHQIKKGISPKNAPTYVEKSEPETDTPKTDSKKYECSICGYVYDEGEEGKSFEDLPDDWTCPICGAGKEEFNEA